MITKLEGRINFCSLMHVVNANFSILSKFEGSLISVKLSQDPKAELHIALTEEGMFTLISDEHRSNTFSEIHSTPSGIVTSCNKQHGGIVIFLNFEQSKKVDLSMVLMEFGRSISSSDEHDSKADSRIELIELGTFILFNDEQPSKQ